MENNDEYVNLKAKINVKNAAKVFEIVTESGNMRLEFGQTYEDFINNRFTVIATEYANQP